MFKKSLRSISILFRYAPGLTILKLMQVAFSAVLAPLSIYFTQRVIDCVVQAVTNGNSLRPLLLWGGLLLLSMFFSSVGGGFLNGILYINIRRRLNHGMTPDILKKFKRLDYACFENPDVHDTLHRMSSDPPDQVFRLFLTITGVIECSIGVIGAAIIFAQVGWWFTLGFAALLIPMIWLDFKAADMVNGMMNSQSADERKMHHLGALLSGKDSLFELKIFSGVDYIYRKWQSIANRVLEVRLKTTLQSQKYFLLSTILFKAWSFFIVLGLVSSIGRGTITMGIFTALISSTGAVLSNADTLSHTVQNLRQRYLLIEHYDRFISLPEISDGGQRPILTTPHITFENVCFTYPNTDRPVLRGVSFKIAPGERVALVGENGAGKSTIIKLLCRLYQPDSGRILINGLDIQALDAAALRQVFSVVFQDFCRYFFTLRENVAFGDIQKLWEDDALKSALEMGLADQISDLDTPLGKLEDNGVDLSGGQWQRIAIARACLPDSAFVILDEPTASLDPVAESRMYHSFAEVLHNRGCIMISHRMASARMADTIIVLSEGVVMEAGNHQALLAAGGLYARMYASQSAWYTSSAGGAEQ